MVASPQGRVDAGQVFLIFGDGTIGNNIDTAIANPRVLQIHGVGVQENTGSEIWLDDLTGDGLGDLIIGRQNYNAPGRTGAGALTIVIGNEELAAMAARDEVLDLAAPPAEINVITFIGAATLDRLGMWMRTGDVDGDGIADLAVSADQADTAGEANSGTVYVIRGGPHLDLATTINLANFGASGLSGHILKFNPPAAATSYHFGSTLALSDLDGNGRAEIYASASLNRSGGSLPAAGAPPGSAVGSGGNLGGSVFIFWDDNVPDADPWEIGLTIDFDSAPGTTTRIDGSNTTDFNNERFGEELLAGADYDGNGTADLFVGDITGSPAGRERAGVGHVFFSAAELRGLAFDMSDVPVGQQVTTIFGPSPGAISTDTAIQGDFDGDGLADLAVGSPLDDPMGRDAAGTVQILWGQATWPGVIDLASAARPDPSVFTISEILGAAGASSDADSGDTLMYSAATGDINHDGVADLIINEMRGNGVSPDAVDVGNLLVIPGNILIK
jgi:hypothetical protein